MKDYYSILGVERTASVAEIKRAFRHLAVRYHPDKNPDPSAAIHFHDINEAYEILGDEVKRATYDARYNNPWMEFVEEATQSYTPPHRDPAFQRRAPRAPQPSARQRLREQMQNFIPFFSSVIRLSLVVASLCLADVVLPVATTPEKVIATEIDYFAGGKRQIRKIEVITGNGGRFSLPDGTRVPRIGAIVKFTRTPILRVPVAIESHDASFDINSTIYRSFVFSPIIMTVMAILFFLSKGQIEKAFNYGLGCLFFFILTLIFYFNN